MLVLKDLQLHYRLSEGVDIYLQLQFLFFNPISNFHLSLRPDLQYQPYKPA